MRADSGSVFQKRFAGVSASQGCRAVLVVAVMAATVLMAACAPPSSTLKPTGATALSSVATPNVATPNSNVFDANARLEDGLEKLKSYRTFVTYSMEGQDKLGNNQKLSIVMAKETVPGSANQHVKLNTYATISTTISGSTDLYLVDGNVYVFNPYLPPDKRCLRLPAQVARTVNPGTLFKPNDVMGLLDHAELVKGDEVIDGVAVKKYSGEDKDSNGGPFESAKGDLWLASDGSYIIKYVGQATGKTALLGDNSAAVITWDYAIKDIGKFEDISLPVECPLPVPANGTSRQVVNPNAKPTATVMPAPVEVIPFLADATDIVKDNGITTFTTGVDRTAAEKFYQQQLLDNGWSQNLNSSDAYFIQSAYCSTPQYQAGSVSLVIPQSMAIYSKGMRTVTVFVTNMQKGAIIMLMDSGAI